MHRKRKEHRLLGSHLKRGAVLLHEAYYSGRVGDRPYLFNVMSLFSRLTDNGLKEPRVLFEKAVDGLFAKPSRFGWLFFVDRMT